VTEFVSKLADTVLWSSIGAVVLGLILKLRRFNITIGNIRLPACTEVRCGLPVIQEPDIAAADLNRPSDSDRLVLAYLSSRPANY